MAWSCVVEAARCRVAAADVGNDPQYLFADLLLDEAQTALLLDASGYVLAGVYLDSDGKNVSQDIGAQLSGISDEVRRSTRHLDIGRVEVDHLRDAGGGRRDGAGAPDSLLVVAASRATPLGLLRRLLDRCAGRARRTGSLGRAVRERRMSSPFASMLETLTRQRGVRASLIVSERDGVIVDSNLRFGQDGDRVAALAASMYRKARLSARRRGSARSSFLQLDAERGRICAVAAAATS